MKLRLSAITFALLSLFGHSQKANAQSTIFNVPSTDVVAENRFYVEADFISHLTSYSNGGFQSYGLRGNYGLKKNVEVGVNIFYTRTGAVSPAEIQPNVKWKAYSNEKHGVAISGGALLFIPLNKQSGSRVYGMFYTNVSKVFKNAGGMRLTGGAYTVVGAKKEQGTKNGALLGFEKPLFRKVNFIADWYSGKNRFGYAAAGFSAAITPKQTLFAGYNFGNAGRGNNSLSIFYGYSF